MLMTKSHFSSISIRLSVTGIAQSARPPVILWTVSQAHPLYDWRYVTIATVAGIAYGIVYNRTGKVTAAAITHSLVDIVRGLCF